MASALVWQLIKDNNSFLVKRGRTHRDGAVQFSAEAGNLLNVNSLKFSGLAASATAHVAHDASVTVKVSIFSIENVC
jgi:large subunit ribosomal protein L28e